MKLFPLTRLAGKYLIRYRRRYLFLFLALSFGFGIVTLMTSVKDGMYRNVYNSAQGHYAGDIVAVGYDKGLAADGPYLDRENMDAVFKAAEAVKLNPVHSAARTIFGERGVLYYNGAAVRLKYVIGADWDKEAAYFNGLEYLERRDSFEGEDAILLSAPVAEELGARLGDRLILEVDTRGGQKNTGVFIVNGLVKDSTIFGYHKVYIPRITLNRLLLFGDDECSSIGFFLADPGEAGKKQAFLQRELSKTVPAGPLVKDREELALERNRPWTGVKVFILTIPVYLSEVADLLGAIRIIAYFLYAVMLLIIFVSALVTWRLILRERSRELGTMRAVGFYGTDLLYVLLVETLALALVSLIAGFFLSFFFSWLVTCIPFSWFPSFEIFMKDGKLRSLYLPETMLINIAAVFAVLIAAVWEPAFRSSRDHLPEMLSGRLV
ncbi:MAG: ABC transporter permease [Treponema sp.]|jgi:ABC-type lipoprotein release transport system permease subunit|nr:ABC transporter permease [Treponema sp.]